MYYLSIIPDVKMLVLVMNDLHQFKSVSSDPEEWGSVLKVTKSLMKPGKEVVCQTEVGTDAIGSVLFCS